MQYKWWGVEVRGMDHPRRTHAEPTRLITPERVSWLAIGLASLGLIVTMFAR